MNKLLLLFLFLLRWISPRFAFIYRGWLPQDFPIMESGKLAPDVGLPGYLVSWYRTDRVPVYFFQVRDALNFPVEIIPGKEIYPGIEMVVEVPNGRPFIIPLVVNSPLDVVIKKCGSEHQEITLVRGCKQRRLIYVPCPPGPHRVLVSKGGAASIGKPIPLTNTRRQEGNASCTVVFFVDGLEWTSFERVILTTKAKHEKCTYAKTHVNGDWTVTSVPTLLSGRYVSFNKIYSRADDVSGIEFPLVEEFSRNGSYATHLTANWGLTPTQGYHKKFDRTIYCRYFELEDLISEVRQSERLFSNRDTFYLVSAMDLHHDIRGLPRADETINYDPSFFDFTDREKANGILGFNEARSARYQSSVRRVIGSITDFIDSMSLRSEKKLNVFLISDHGQAYLGNSFESMANNRAYVPFAYWGKEESIHETLTDTVLENIDISGFITSHLLETERLQSQPNIISGSEGRWCICESVVRHKDYSIRLSCGDSYWIFDLPGFRSLDPTLTIDDFVLRVTSERSVGRPDIARVLEVLDEFLDSNVRKGQ